MNRAQKGLLLVILPLFVGFALGRIPEWGIVAVVGGILFSLSRGFSMSRDPNKTFTFLLWCSGYILLVITIAWIVLTWRDTIGGEGSRTLPRWWGP